MKRKNTTIVRLAFLLIIAISINACDNNDHLQIPNTLEIALQQNNEYCLYVSLLKKSLHSDTASLHKFLNIDNIYDAASYEHGSMLLFLLNKIGDNNFSTPICTMSNDRISNLRAYIIAGLDSSSEHDSDNFRAYYPETFRCLLMETESFYWKPAWGKRMK